MVLLWDAKRLNIGTELSMAIHIATGVGTGRLGVGPLHFFKLGPGLTFALVIALPTI